MMRFFKITIFASINFIVFFNFAVSARAATFVSGAISSDTVWMQANSPYVVQGSLTVASTAVLTIEPGVVVKLDTPLFYHTFNIFGALNVLGTADNKAYFTSFLDDSLGGDTNGDGPSSSPAPGDWTGIFFENSSSGNLTNLVIQYAGRNSSLNGCSCALVNFGGNLTLSNVQISKTNANGVRQLGGTIFIGDSELSGHSTAVWLEGGTANISGASIRNNVIGINAFDGSLTLTDNSFVNNSEVPAKISGRVDFVHSNNASIGSQKNGFLMSGTLSANQIWNQDSMPYIVQNFTVPSGRTLILKEGVVVKFFQPSSFDKFEIAGALNIQGATTDKVYFTSIKDDSIGGDTNNDGSTTVPAPANWNMVVFSSGSLGNISNAVIRYAGNYTSTSGCACAFLNLGGILNISNFEIYSNTGIGIRQDGGNAAISNSSIYDNSDFGIKNISLNVINAKNNWWGSSSGPFHQILNPSGMGNKVSDNVDFIPWLGYDPTKNQPPIISNIGQFKSDAITPITESGLTTEDIVIFKTKIDDSNNDQVKLQIELRQFNEPFTGVEDGGILTSDFFPSGNEVLITRFGFSNGLYKWRARTTDDKGALSEWQEFGTAGNIDFEVKLVPLYTQVESQFPPRTEEEEWAGKVYAEGRGAIDPDGPEGLEESCGLTIRDCGCAITSAVMVLRYHGVASAVDNQDVNPLNFNNWLNANNGYGNFGDLDWPKVAEYSKFPNTNLARVRYDGRVDFQDASTLNNYLKVFNPIVVKNSVYGHFLVADGILGSTYTVRDPAWYNTRKLDEERTDRIAKIRDYNNYFDGLRLYIPTLAGGPIDGISLNLASPAELLVTDPQGRKLGKDPITGILYDEIPGGSYGSEGIGNADSEVPVTVHQTKNIWITQPEIGNYSIKVIGAGAGDYTLQSLIYDSQSEPHSQTFTGSIQSNLVIDYNANFTPNQPENIKVELVDEIPPEAKISLNQDTFDINIEGIDISPTVVSQISDTAHQIQDQAGNTTILNFRKIKDKKHSLHLELESVRYGSGQAISLPKNRLHYEWAIDKKEDELRVLNQHLFIKGELKVYALFKEKRNETAITIITGKDKDGQKIKQTAPGLAIIKLITKSGVLDFEF